MKVSSRADGILKQINSSTKLGDLRRIAKEIKKDHVLAMELWSSGRFLPRLLAILIMDSKQITAGVIDKLVSDMQVHNANDKNQLIDWLMANQITKDKKLAALIGGWERSPSPLLRRVFWYHQGRLRWTGQAPPDNTAELLTKIEKNIMSEPPEVQWAMNFLAGWIGVYEEKFRKRCVAIGEKTGLYRNEKVSKGCTPNYLPEFIAIESRKRNR